MGVRILSGIADGTNDGAALYDSVTGRLLGDIWESGKGDAEGQALAFVEWVRRLKPVALIAEIDLGFFEIPDGQLDPGDIRSWPYEGHRKIAGYFRRTYVDDRGDLSADGLELLDAAEA